MIRELRAMPSSKVLQADYNGVYVLKFIEIVFCNVVSELILFLIDFNSIFGSLTGAFCL